MRLFILVLLILGVVINKELQAAPLPSISPEKALSTKKTPVQPKDNIDWTEFLSRSDMTWSKVPKSWDEAPFMGNGELGLMVFRRSDNELRFQLGHGRAQEQRKAKINNLDAMLYRSRVMIGDFDLKTAGKITGCAWRLDLAKAELRGDIITDKGKVTLRSYVHATKPLIIIEAIPQEGEIIQDFEWKPELAISTRLLRNYKDKIGSPEFPKNPEPVKGEKNGIQFWEQPIIPNYCLSTAWKQTKQQGGKRLVINISYGKQETNITQKALTRVKNALSQSKNRLDKEHYAWWKNFYPASFVSFPDAYWESFYWIQMYKLASATRSHGMTIDTCGPWMQYTTWGGVWWNLNVQLSYWPCYVSNRLELADSLRLNMKLNRDQLIKTVPEQYQADSAAVGRDTGQEFEGTVGYPGTKHSGLNAEVGNLPWACHNLWLQYAVTQDENILRQDVYPILRRAINYYLHFVTQDNDGKWHLPKTHSPEYADAADCNFDLALLKWGCLTLIESTKILKINDPLIPRWKDVAQNLTPFPADEQGYKIGKDTKLTSSHRHFSHLLMVYPLHLVDMEDPKEKERILTSLDHWHSFKGALQGYSFTGGSLIASALKDGERAYSILEGLKNYDTPNTLYKEGGGPVIETPLSAAQSIHEMLLQSYGGIIRPFPAMPQKWANASFRDLRAEGAFLVSASWENNALSWLHITSLAGKPCIIQLDVQAPIYCDKLPITKLSSNKISLPLKKNESVLLYVGEKPKHTKATPIPWTEPSNPLGLK